MDRPRIARTLLVVTIIYVAGFYFIGAAIKPGYSQLSNFISEYNATGTARAGMLTYAGFVATALLLAAFLVVAAPVTRTRGVSRVGFWLLWSIPVSYLIAGVAPCDAGCPLEGSISQQVHNAGSVIAYFGMGASVALVSLAPGFGAFPWRRAFMLLVGIAFPVVFSLMVQPDLAPWRGLMQRSLDAALALSLVLIAWTLTPAADRAPENGVRFT